MPGFRNVHATMEHLCHPGSKMHKRRIDMLGALVSQLNPQYYLLVCRQLDFELAEAYSF